MARLLEGEPAKLAVLRASDGDVAERLCWPREAALCFCPHGGAHRKKGAAENFAAVVAGHKAAPLFARGSEARLGVLVVKLDSVDADLLFVLDIATAKLEDEATP